MKNLKIQAWKELDNLSSSRQYKYPGANLPKKNLSEGLALQKFLPSSCKGIFLDYGCGEGIMFNYIKKYYKRFPSLIIAVDPDYSRLIKAKRVLLREGRRGVSLNTAFDNPIFRKKSLKGSLSCIICIQVFGHVPQYRLIKTLETFHFLLEPHGSLIIAIPFVNNQFVFPEWNKGADFFCLVNCLSNSKSSKSKIILSEKDFSYFADYPLPNLLPTRRFFIDEKRRLGTNVRNVKIVASRLGRSLSMSGFSVKNAIVYKEKPEKGSGDIMLSIHRSSKFQSKRK